MSKLYSFLLLLLSIGLIIVLQFGFIFVLLALLPSFSAFFVDTDRSKAKFKVIFSCNFAAMLPTVVPMFNAGINFQPYDINSTLFDPMLWIFIYGGAAAGWAIIHISHMMAYHLANARNQIIIEKITDKQNSLVDEWGSEVKDLPVPSKKR